MSEFLKLGPGNLALSSQVHWEGWAVGHRHGCPWLCLPGTCDLCQD